MAKYRGTTSYFVAYGELIQAARYRGLTTYQAVAQLVGLPLHGSYMGSQIGHLLGEIVEDEVALGRPMLSAVCVGVSGEPGDGFYGLAEELGRFSGSSLAEKRAFWKSELEAVYAAWAREFKK